MGIRISREQAKAMGLDVPKAKKKSDVQVSKPYPMFEAMCIANGIPKPMRESVFDPNRMWRFDFSWLEDLEAGGTIDKPFVKGFRTKIALEIQGGIYGRGKPCPTCKRRPVGAHSSITYMKEQIEKYNAATILGWKVLQCLPEDVESGAVFALLRKAFGIKD